MDAKNSRQKKVGKNDRRPFSKLLGVFIGYYIGIVYGAKKYSYTYSCTAGLFS